MAASEKRRKEGPMEERESAVILCGGKSLRAGREKQLLLMKDKIIALFIAEKLEELFSEILIVTNKPELYEESPYQIVRDIYQDCGPLGGIHSGLSHSTSRFVYLTACDMPNISLPAIRWMRDQFLEDRCSYDAAVVRRDNGFLEPFNGFYSKESLPLMERALTDGRLSFMSLYPDLHVLYIEEKEMAPFTRKMDIFVNLNHPYEIEEYLKQPGCTDSVVKTSVHSREKKR